MAYRPSKLCWICGCAVALEDCKVDEQGLPVHDNCYVAKVASKNAARQVDHASRPKGSAGDNDDAAREA
jgi:hypothetical protein